MQLFCVTEGRLANDRPVACELVGIEAAGAHARMALTYVNVKTSMIPVQDKATPARHRTTLACAWFTAFVIATIAYWPGLQGAFVLDDFGVLSSLGDLGGVRDWETFKAFVLGGTAGPTGRPLALLSFLVDANNWPADPWAFKRTNLVIHLANAALLGVLTKQVLLLVGIDHRRAAWLAFFSAAAWMLHPFLVSTTLYIVQRMTQLAMFFTTGGMVTYLYGRSLLEVNRVRAYLAMTAGLGVFTVLGVLCKESAALLPMLVLVLEYTVLASAGNTVARLDRRWMTVFLVLPSAFIILYLAQSFLRADIFEIAPAREFSLYERVLTQPRVVVTYLQHWFIPKLYTTGVFQDHIIKSTGILAPVTTLFAAVFHLGLVVLATMKRRQLPLLAFAILFFYSYHLLESTVLNLELYFEHRNYVPSAFLFLPLVAFIGSRVDVKKAMLLGIVLLLALAGFTRYSATVWSDYDSMIEASAFKAPTSARAQVLFARNLFNAGNYEASLIVIDRAAETIETSAPMLQVNRALIHCKLGLLTDAEMDKVVDRLSPLTYDPRYLEMYEAFVDTLAADQCVANGTASQARLFASILENDQSLKPGTLSLSHVRYLNGVIALRRQALDEAMVHFRAAVAAQPTPSATMKMAGLMATNQDFAAAYELSGIALEQIKTAGTRDNVSVIEENIRQFRDEIRAAMAITD